MSGVKKYLYKSDCPPLITNYLTNKDKNCDH